MMLSADSLKTFLVERVGLDETKIGEDTVLFSSGMVDSFAMLELITFIEDKGRLRMEPSDVSLDNLDSIAQILSYVARRQT